MKIKSVKLDNQGLKNETKWFLIFTSAKGNELTMNVGEKTHKTIQEFIEEEEQQELPLKENNEL